MVQPPTGILTAPPGRGSTSRPAACLQDEDRALITASPQACHQGCAGQTSTNNGQVYGPLLGQIHA
jgi:hypothetical protein